MRYPASEKLEIIRLVEKSYLPVKQTLDKLGIPRTRFIAGTTTIRPADPQHWKIDHRCRHASGTVSRMMFASGLLT